MQTFDLETCKRLSKLLGEDCPKTSFWWVSMQGKEPYSLTGLPISSAANGNIPAFTLSDLTASVWQEIGKKLGWTNRNDVAWTVGEDEQIGLNWWNRALRCYDAFLHGGMSKADAYLFELIK